MCRSSDMTNNSQALPNRKFLGRLWPNQLIYCIGLEQAQNQKTSMTVERQNEKIVASDTESCSMDWSCKYFRTKKNKYSDASANSGSFPICLRMD
ncbi:hypothetical protein CEXT_502931 [Caerostris extrusa]|uniref:Uncharacterized protein n=1 Tax=Caerostris extrusa TaxID=172846 RepID=A0AAV4UAL0_CAEEX|nr:hypothetical protein CEXT_502931 [Caerostris extrusa]